MNHHAEPGDRSGFEDVWRVEFQQPPPDDTVLDQAKALVYGDRNAAYGHPADDWARTAKLWSAILGFEVTPQQAVLCMVAVKISRECHQPAADNRVDGAGYFAALDRIERRKTGLE